MAWKLLSVPRIAHFFWDDSPLSFLRWMTLKSFSTLNPDWKLILHTSRAGASPNWASGHNKQVVREDLRGRLGDIRNLEIHEEDDELAALPGVQQSDILRNRYLCEHGGLWSDMDVLYYRPMDQMLCNVEGYEDFQSGLCIRDRWFPIGFMMAAKGSPFFEAVLGHQMAMVNSSGRPAYQRFGTGVYKSVISIGKHKYIPIDTGEVYQHAWNAHRKIFSGALNLQLGVGIHWYGGSESAAQHEPRLTLDTWKSHPLSAAIGATA